MFIMISTKPNVQRRVLGEAHLSQRRNMLAAHLSRELRKQYKRRSMSLRKGDEVKIIRGEHFGESGEIVGVDLKKRVIFVGGVKLKRTVGTEKQVPIEPSNVVITSLKLDDHARQSILLRKVKEVVVPKEKKEAVKTEPDAGEKKEEPRAEHSQEKHHPKDEDSSQGHSHPSDGRSHEGNSQTHNSHAHLHPNPRSPEHAVKSDAKLSHVKKVAPKNAAGKGDK